MDIQQFENINKPETSYILGLLWADGYISRPTKTSRAKSINILASKSDLDEVLPVFKSLGGWKTYERPSEIKKYRLHIYYTSAKLWLVFKNYDYGDKSFINPNKVLSAVPNNLKHYWWRGYFDGDGSISDKGRVTFTSSFEQDYTFLTDLLTQLGIKTYYESRKIYQSGSFSQVSFGMRAQTEKFYNYLYQGESFGFSRKRSTFDVYLKGGSYLD